MEPLWSPVVANGGNHLQIGRARNWRKQAETVAVGCNQLPPGLDGKEGVDGSSPSEGFCKDAARRRVWRSERLAASAACSGCGAVNGAFKSKTVSGWCR